MLHCSDGRLGAEVVCPPAPSCLPLLLGACLAGLLLGWWLRGSLETRPPQFHPAPVRPLRPNAAAEAELKAEAQRQVALFRQNR